MTQPVLELSCLLSTNRNEPQKLREKNLAKRMGGGYRSMQETYTKRKRLTGDTLNVKRIGLKQGENLAARSDVSLTQC